MEEYAFAQCTIPLPSRQSKNQSKVGGRREKIPRGLQSGRCLLEKVVPELLFAGSDDLHAYLPVPVDEVGLGEVLALSASDALSRIYGDPEQTEPVE